MITTISNHKINIKIKDWIVFWNALLNFIKIWIKRWYKGGQYKYKGKIILDWKDLWSNKFINFYHELVIKGMKY